MITNIQGLGSLNYTSNEPQSLDVTFRSDYWEEVLATGWGDNKNGNINNVAAYVEQKNPTLDQSSASGSAS